MFSSFFDYPKGSTDKQSSSKYPISGENLDDESIDNEEPPHLSTEFEYLFRKNKPEKNFLYDRFKKYQSYKSTFFDRDVECSDIERVHEIGFKLTFEDLFGNSSTKEQYLPTPNCISESIYSSECEMNQFSANNIIKKKSDTSNGERNITYSSKTKQTPNNFFNEDTKESCKDFYLDLPIPVDIIKYVIIGKNIYFFC